MHGFIYEVYTTKVNSTSWRSQVSIKRGHRIRTVVVGTTYQSQKAAIEAGGAWVSGHEAALHAILGGHDDH